jgi:putative peptidoglycan lipid II flippase
VAILGYAQLVALLPVSLFGVSVAAVALPELSRDVAANDTEALRVKLAVGTRRIAFFVLPAAVAFAVLSQEIIAGLFQTGAFGTTQSAVAGGVLAAYAIGIPAQATIKLFASGHYAHGDTRTPVRIAVTSVIVSAVSAYLLMQRFGPAGIALGAAIGGYVNMSLNFATLERKLGRILGRDELRPIVISVIATLPAALAGAAGARTLGTAPLWASAAAGLLLFGLVYGAIVVAARHPEALGLVRRRTSRRP